MPTLAQLLTGHPTPTELASHLDQLAGPARLAQALALRTRAQASLFELVAGAGVVDLDALTQGAAPLTGVPWEGVNTLYAFRRFAKVFYRPADAVTAKGERWGYNRTSALVTTTVGPGYYVAVPHGPAEVLVDYTRTPGATPADGPTPRSNGARLSRLVYFNTRDVLRRVSRDVLIGRAMRGERWLDNWFVLVRA
jgi:hypothetical protein